MQPTQNTLTGDPCDPPQVGSTLLAMARHLSVHGWTQEQYYTDPSCLTPSACVVGALSVVAYGYPAEAPADNFTHPGFDEFEAAMCRLGGYLTHTYGRDLGDVYTFNDTPGRTVGEVVAMLFRAATSGRGLWVPRCCDDTRCIPDPDEPYAVLDDPADGPFMIERLYRCATCLRRYTVLAENPGDLDAVRAQWRAWTDTLPHDGGWHEPGTSPSCGVCGTFCFCVEDQCCYFHWADNWDTDVDYSDADADRAGVWWLMVGGAA